MENTIIDISTPSIKSSHFGFVESHRRSLWETSFEGSDDNREDPFKGRETSNLEIFKTLVASLHEKLDALEEDVKFLKNEIEHKNSTITQLLDIVNKVTIRTQHTDTYNHDVDEYNDDVSSYNNTPVKSKNNVTYGRGEQQI